MQFNPIDIKIKDDWKFGEVAYLVDRKDFLEDIHKARKRLEINNLIPHTKEAINSWFQEEQNHKSKNASTSSTTKSQLIKHTLLEKYHKPLFYSFILDASILCGIVTDDDFSVTAHTDIIDPNEYIKRYKQKKFLGYPKLAIVFSPETKLDEIIELYKTSTPDLIDFFKQEYLKTNQHNSRTSPTIRNKRDWYWLNEKGMSAFKIWEELKLKIEPKSIDNAIRDYKKNLQIPLM